MEGPFIDEDGNGPMEFMLVNFYPSLGYLIDEYYALLHKHNGELKGKFDKKENTCVADLLTLWGWAMKILMMVPDYEGGE